MTNRSNGRDGEAGSVAPPRRAAGALPLHPEGAAASNPIHYATLHSPVGLLRLCGDGTHLTRIDFVGGRNCPALAPDAIEQNDALLDRAADQLGQYFAGARKQFDLPLAPSGTEFQQRVWMQLRAIPFGTTCSYGDIARRLGQPGASRAVGLANGKTPLSIVVPCHRAIGADGSLTGFGGGVEVKKRLLELESPLPLLARSDGGAEPARG